MRQARFPAIANPLNLRQIPYHDFNPDAQVRITFRDELAEVLAKHHVAIGVSVPEVVPDATDDLAKCWSEWQDLNLRPPRPERGGARHERWGGRP